MRRYRITLLSTAEGINLKKDKTRDTVLIFLWAKDKNAARAEARKIADALAVPTHVGTIEYVIKRITECARK